MDTQRHQARHKLPRFVYESLALVSVWCAIMVATKDATQPNEVEIEIRRHYLADRENPDYMSVILCKEHTLRDPTAMRTTPFPPAFHHGNLRSWFRAFQPPFWEGRPRSEHIEQEQLDIRDSWEGKADSPIIDETFDQSETMHGEVTLDTFLESFALHEERLARSKKTST